MAIERGCPGTVAARRARWHTSDCASSPGRGNGGGLCRIQALFHSKKVNAILQSGMRLSNLDPRSHYGQITLVETRVRPNKSYTALIPDDLARGLPTNVTAKVEIRGMPIANMRCWIVTDISTS